ncbi:MAG TPA: hypothetical protein DD727_06915 [Clostridiales bacterium]|nr:hypothetical protein [Clostridiales bacterium]
MEAVIKSRIPCETTRPDHTPRSCVSCLLGTSMVVNGDVLCRLKGAVSRSYCCRRYKPSPFCSSTTGPEASLTCSSCKFFDPDSTEGDPVERIMRKTVPLIGLCSLFSVRKYDGCSRKACSKFISKDTREAC